MASHDNVYFTDKMTYSLLPILLKQHT